MDKIDKFLFDAGVDVSLKGFEPLKRIIEVELKEPEIGLCDLMNQIAKERGTTFLRIEKNVRFAIQNCNMSKEIASLFKSGEKITTKRFVKTAVYAIKNNLV